jgi:hypothetical protein
MHSNLLQRRLTNFLLKANYQALNLGFFIPYYLLFLSLFYSIQ